MRSILFNFHSKSAAIAGDEAPVRHPVILQNSHSEAKNEFIIIRDVLQQVYYELSPPAQ